MYVALNHLQASTVRLHTECCQVVAVVNHSRSGHSSVTSSPAKSPYRGPESAANRQVTQQVIQCAYDIAKAAKSLVTMFQ